MKKLLLYLIMAVVPGIQLALAQGPIPPVPSHPGFISSTGFEARWHQPFAENQVVAQYLIDVALDGSFTNHVLLDHGVSLSAQELLDYGFSVANLDPNTTYAWRVRAVNSDNEESSYSATQFVTTKALPSLTSAAAWFHTYATEFEDYIYGLDSDADGNVYFTGSFGNTLNIGTSSLNSAGDLDIFFAAMDADGEILNAIRVGGAGEDEAAYLKVYGDFVYTGFWLENAAVDVDPGAGVVNAGPGFVLAKYNIVEGTLTWAKTFGDNMDPFSMAVGPEGIILAGDFENVVDFDAGPNTNQRSASGGDDGFVASYTLDGDLEWVGVIASSGSGEFLNEVVVDGSNIYITGHTDYQNTTDVDPGAGVSMVGLDKGFLLKLSVSTGAFVWVQDFSPGAESYISEGSTPVDMGSTIIVAGSFYGYVDFGDGFDAQSLGSQTYSYPGYYVEISKSTGTVVGMRIVPVGYDSDLDVDQMQKVGTSLLVSGDFRGSVDFNFGLGGGERTQGGSQFYEAKYIASYSVTTGLLEWVKTFQFDGESIGGNIHANADGLYFVGGFDGSADLNPPAGDMVAMGNQDMFVVKYGLTTPPSAPAAPSAIAATDVTGSGFTANWNAVGGASFYMVDVSYDDFVSYVNSPGGIIVQGSTSLVVTGLDPLTEYKYRVRTITANGASISSNVISVTTGAAGPPPPSNFYQALVSNTGFIVKFDPVPDATGYEIELSDDNFASIMTDYSATIPVWDHPYWNLAGLAPSTPYWVRVRAVDATGTSVNSPVLNVTTLAHPEAVSSNLWADTYGGLDSEWIKSIANDPWGNVYVTGVAQGAAFNIGGFTLNPLGGADMFIAKFNSSGEVQWAHRIGSSLDDEGWNVTADAHGVYLTGAFSGTVDFDPTAGTTALIANGNTGHPLWTYLDDGFIAKYNHNGSIAWAKSLGNAWTSWHNAKTLFVDDDGKGLAVTGIFVGTNDFDPNGGTWNLTSAGGSDIFIAKFDRWTGAINWAQRLGGTLDDEGTSITGDFSNLYVAGSHKGDIDLNPTSVTYTITGPGSYVSSYSKGGAFLWTRSYQNNIPTGGSNVFNGAEYFGVAITDLALDNDNVYAVGTFTGVADFDPGAGTANRYGGFNTGFATKLTKDGDYVFAGNSYSYGGDGLYPARVLVDAAGFYVVGGASWSVDFDPGPDEAVRTSRAGDMFIARYNSADGGFQWAKTIGSWGNESLGAAALTNDGIYIAGGLDNTVNFDPYEGSVERNVVGQSDLFIAKYESTSPPPPPVPVQLTPAFVSNTGVNTVWYAIPDGLEYRVDVSSDDFSTFAVLDGEMVSRNVGVVYNYWTNLQPSTTYKMRVASVAAGGIRSAYSNVETFTTAPHPPQISSNIWTSTFGSTLADEVTGVALDGSDNVYTTGVFRGNITLGSTTLTNAGFSDVFFAKYNSSGTVQWAKSLSSSDAESGISIAVDATGLYILGTYLGSSNLDFDPDAGVQLISGLGTTYNSFVAKYSLVDGSFIWAKPLNDSFNATGKSIQADGTGVYITGAFLSGSDFDPGAGTATQTTVGGEDVFLARYSATDGSFVWLTNFGSPLNDLGYSVLLDGSFVYTSGFLLGPGDLDPGVGTINGLGGAYISKFNTADGSLVWAKSLDGAEYAFDLDKNATDLFVSGTFKGDADFDPGAGTHSMNSTYSSGYVARYTLADGDFTSVSVMNANSLSPRRIIVDNTGYYIGGNGAAGIDFDPGIGEDNRHGAYLDAVLARYTTEGELVWAKTIGSYFDDVIRGGLALGADGLYAGGYFAGTPNFDPYLNDVSVSSVGSVDGFLAKYQIEVSAPAAPVANAATDVTATGFTANWSSAAGAANYRLDVSTSDTFADFLPGFENLTVSQLSKGLTGLQPNATYYYQVRAVNGAGVSGNSNAITVTTSGPVLAAPVANPANTISATAFMSSWTSVATATGYQLDVSADDFTTYVPGYQNRSIEATSEGVIGLNAQVQYHYRVRAVEAGGTSVNSNVVDVTTLVNPPLPPLATAATAITASSFTANWNTSVGASGYKLDVSTDNFITFVSGYDGKTVAGTSDVLSGLPAHKSYQYRVKATNAGGASFNSNFIVAVTAYLPIPPQTTPATAITINSFTANWNAVGDADSYRLDVSSDNFVNFVAGFNDKTVAGTFDDITGLSPSTAYKYRVRAVNANGTSNNSAIVDVTTLALPNAPNATAATSITGTSFTANWTSVAGATSYRLDVSIDNFATNIIGYSDKTVSGTSATLTGLAPSTAFKYRVRAVDANGTSLNSNVQSVTTMPLPAAPNATAATAITISSFVANWDAVAGATSYRLDVSADDFTSLLTGYSDLSVSATSSPVTGLNLNASYKYRVRAVDANGTSLNSNTIDVQTLDGVAAPVVNAASSITSGGFTASWSAVDGATGYQLDVSLNNFVSFVPGFFNKPVTGTNAAVVGLSPETAYQYRVRAVDATGPSENSNVESVTTLPIPVPVAVFATSITSTTFVANWNPSSGAIGYRLDVSADNFATMVVGYSDKSVGGTSDGVTGLIPGGTYEYRVRAVTSVGVSANSNSISVTVNSLPSAPIAQAATNTGITGFTANWSAVPNVNSYQLDISSDNFTTFVTGYNGKSLSATFTSDVVTGLSAGTAYAYRVRSVSVDGVSLNSNTTDVTTQSKQNQTIVMGSLNPKTLGDDPFDLSAAATSGLDVVFTPVTDHTTISGTLVTMIKAGKAKIRASQPGDDTFNSAADLDREFCINPVAPVLQMTNPGTATPALSSNATGTHQWFKDGTVIGGESGTTLNVSVQGVYTAKVTIEGCISEASEEFAVVITGDIAPGARDLVIAPNPADDEILIQLPGSGRREISILQANGTTVHTHATDRDEATINVRSYSGGFYIVKVVSTEGSFYGRFIKK